MLLSGVIPERWRKQAICHQLASHSSDEGPKRAAPHHGRK
jgi:hypothetical protein